MNSTAESRSVAVARGIQRLWDPRVWGTTIGAAGATVFVMTSRGELDDPWPLVALAAWVVAILTYALCVFALPRFFGEIKPVGARQGFVYLGAVAGMLLLIRIGTIVLDDAHKPGLRPALIVIAVGLHFLPFARAFRTRLFLPLGITMVVLGLVGLTGGWIGEGRFAAVMAVITGLVMLIFIAGDAAVGLRQVRTRELSR